MKSFSHPITNINLKLMQGFVMVGQQKSFKRAAELSGFTQSAMSAQIRTLEDQLGIPLFNRTTRTVELTAEGEHLFRSAKRAIDEIGLSLRDIQKKIDLEVGHVSLICTPSFSVNGLAPLVRMFSKDFPTVGLAIREATAAEIVRSLLDHVFDIGIGPVMEAPGLDFEPFRSDPIVALVPDDMLKTAGSLISIKDIEGLPLLLLDKSTSLRQQLVRVAAASGVELTSRYEFSQMQTLVDMAEVGLGVAIVPEGAVRPKHLKQARIFRFRERDLTRHYAIILPKGKAPTPATRQMIKFLRWQKNCNSQAPP